MLNTFSAYIFAVQIIYKFAKMPEYRVPTTMDLLVGLDGADGLKSDATSDTETSSERASSPKSDSSVSELSEASSLSLEFSDNVSEEGGDGSPGPHQDILLEDLAALKIEETAEEMAKQGADMRHVLHTSWKLQSKYPVGKIIC